MLRAVFCLIQNVGKNVMHYLKWPYPLYTPTRFDDFSHEHICFAARFANVSLEGICPCFKDQKRFIPGRLDACENCRYFGTVFYQRDSETGVPMLLFDIAQWESKSAGSGAINEVSTIGKGDIT